MGVGSTGTRLTRTTTRRTCLLTGYYDSLDPETVRRQIRQAKAAGIDGFIASWWGPRSFEDRAFHVLLRVAEEESFLVTIYYEDAATPAQIVTDVSAIVFRYASSPAFLVDRRLPRGLLLRPRGGEVHDRRVARRLRRPRREPSERVRDRRPSRSDLPPGVPGAPRLQPRWDDARGDTGAVRGRVVWRRGSRATLFAATAIPGYQEGYPGATGPVSRSRRRRNVPRVLGHRAGERAAVDPHHELERVARGDRRSSHRWSSELRTSKSRPKRPRHGGSARPQRLLGPPTLPAAPRVRPAHG